MANFSQNETQMVLVGKNVAKTTTTIAAIADGEIALFTPGGTMYTESTADAGDVFAIYLGRATALGPLRTEYFSKADVTSVVRKAYVAPTEQLDYIGSTGSAGSIRVSNNTVYRATVALDQNLPETSEGGIKIKDLVYESDSDAAQSEIALGLANSGYKNLSREAEEEIVFAAICDDAGDALGTGMNAMVWTKGSKIVTADDVDDATTNPAIAVGGFLRAGTTVTSDVYKIVAIDATANTITLDSPFRGASISGVDTAYESITAADGAAGNWGVSLTAQNSTTSTPGNGTNNQVAELEYFSNGNNGEVYRNNARNNFPFTANTVAGETYDVIEINIDRGRSGLIATSNPKTISLFITSSKTTSGNNHYALAAATDDITDMLEDLMIGVQVFGGAVTANGGALADGDLALT